MSSSNRESFAFIAESTWGVTPSTPTGQKIEFTSNTVGQTNEAVSSQTVRADTNRAGVVRTGINAGGDINFEFQYAALDSFLEAVLRSAFGSDVNISASTISAAAADNSLNGSATTEFANITEGQWIRVAGFTGTVANNGYMKVVDKVSNAKIIVAGKTLVNDAEGETVTIKGAYMENGTTVKSYTVERHFEDITEFISVTGCRVAELSLSFQTASIVTGSLSLLGKEATSATSTIWSGTTAAVSNTKFNTVDNIDGIYIDNALSTLDFTQLDLTISTNSEALKKLGQLAAASVDQRSISVTGTLGAYFEDATLLSKSFNFTSFKLALLVEDEDGNAYVIDMQNCRITGGGPDNPGLDQTVTTPFTFEATYDTDSGATISVTKIAA